MVIVGTCGNCGGPVQIPECWGGSTPPPKKCAHCGATAKPNFGPVLPMQPKPEGTNDEFFKRLTCANRVTTNDA